jgi:hypothetical protein
MGPQDKAALAERMKREARQDNVVKILRELDSYQETVHQSLARCDVDFLWWDLWKSALGFWAKCPSNEVRAAVREAVRARIPAPYVLTDEDRAVLLQHESTMAVYEPDLDTAEDSHER